MTTIEAQYLPKLSADKRYSVQFSLTPTSVYLQDELLRVQHELLDRRAGRTEFDIIGDAVTAADDFVAWAHRRLTSIPVSAVVIDRQSAAMSPVIYHRSFDPRVQ